MKVSVKESIVIHICYRDVFNAPVAIEELKKWVGIKNGSQQQFDSAISELKGEGLIIEKMGYLACAGKESIILDQTRKSRLTKQIISKGQKGLAVLSKLPFIKFVGISGSVAAENPSNDISEKDIDLDLFVVTSRNSLWCFILMERVFATLVKVFRRDHFYCLNYITNESFLEIYNKNFYTATELINLKPVYNKDFLGKIISSNKWFEKYYDKDSVENIKAPVAKYTLYSKILVPINFVFFILFGILRSLKRLDWVGISELKTTFDPSRRFNLHRKSSANGGYQEAIEEKFRKLLKGNFNKYFSENLVAEVFPQNNSFSSTYSEEMRKYKRKQLAVKYTS